MKKSRKLYRNLIIFAIGIYFVCTLFNQQSTLSLYEKDAKNISQKIEEEKEKKKELAKKKEDVDSLEFIEQTAREKLDMYYPNERVYVDKGM